MSSHPCRFQVHGFFFPTPLLSVRSVSHQRLGRGRSRRLPLRRMKRNGSSQLGDQRASLAMCATHCFLMFFGPVCSRIRERGDTVFVSLCPRLKPPSAEFQTSTLDVVFFLFFPLCFICLIASFSAGVPLCLRNCVCLPAHVYFCLLLSSERRRRPCFLRIRERLMGGHFFYVSGVLPSLCPCCRI